MSIFILKKFNNQSFGLISSNNILSNYGLRINQKFIHTSLPCLSNTKDKDNKIKNPETLKKLDNSLHTTKNSFFPIFYLRKLFHTYL